MSFYVNYRDIPEAKGFCKTYLSHEATLQLIEAVRKHDHLWNDYNECYDFSGQIQVSWNSIIGELFENGCADADLTIDTWINLYTAYYDFLQGKVVNSAKDREYLTEIERFVSGLVHPEDCCFEITKEEFQNFPSIKKHYLYDRKCFDYQRKHRTKLDFLADPFNPYDLPVYPGEPSGSYGAIPRVYGASSNPTYPAVSTDNMYKMMFEKLQNPFSTESFQKKYDFVEQVRKLGSRVNDLFHEKLNIELQSIDGNRKKGDFSILNALTTEKLYEIEQGIDKITIKFEKTNFNLEDGKRELSKLEKDTCDVEKYICTLKKLSKAPAESKETIKNSQSTSQSDQSENSTCQGFSIADHSLSKAWDPVSCEKLVQTHQFTQLSDRVRRLSIEHLNTANRSALDNTYTGDVEVIAGSIFMKLCSIQDKCIMHLGMRVERDYDDENGRKVLLKLTKEVEDVEKSIDKMKKMSEKVIASKEEIEKCTTIVEQESSSKPAVPVKTVQKPDELKNATLSKSEFAAGAPEVQALTQTLTTSAEVKPEEVPLSTTVPTVPIRSESATFAAVQSDIVFVPYEEVNPLKNNKQTGAKKAKTPVLAIPMTKAKKNSAKFRFNYPARVRMEKDLAAKAYINSIILRFEEKTSLEAEKETKQDSKVDDVKPRIRESEMLALEKNRDRRNLRFELMQQNHNQCHRISNLINRNSPWRAGKPAPTECANDKDNEAERLLTKTAEQLSQRHRKNKGRFVDKECSLEEQIKEASSIEKELVELEKAAVALKKSKAEASKPEEPKNKGTTKAEKGSSIEVPVEASKKTILPRSESTAEAPEVQTHNKVSTETLTTSAEVKLVEVPLSTKVAEQTEASTLVTVHGDIVFVPYEQVIAEKIEKQTESSEEVAGFEPTETTNVASATQPLATKDATQQEAPAFVLEHATVAIQEAPAILDPEISTEQTSAVIQDQSITMNTLIESESAVASNSAKKSSNLIDIEEVDKKIKLLMSMKTVLTTVENSHDLSKRIDRKIEALEQNKVNIIKAIANLVSNTPKMEMNEVVEPHVALDTETVEEVLLAAPEPAIVINEQHQVIHKSELNIGVTNPKQPVVTGNAGEVIQNNSLTTTEHFIIHIMSVFIVIFLYHYFTIEV